MKSPHPGMGFREFVACIALIQACVAMAIDMMVPALGTIAQSLHISQPNERQWVVTAFVLGFGAAQLIYGTLADRFGRKKLLIIALAIYALCSFAAAASGSLAELITARVLQGVGAAGLQVVTTSIIRDCYAGRRMAEVNSLAFMVFLSAPILAPSAGQAVLMIAPWPAIFIMLGLYALGIIAWVALRLPETQHKEDRRAISWSETMLALNATLRNRMSLGYSLAMTLVLGSWLGFINSAQQVFAHVFLAPKLFPIIFATCSIFMAVAALTNARLVERLGMRVLTHSATFGFIFMALSQAGLAISGHDSLVTFTVLQSGMMFCFGLLAGNISAIAMEPLGHIAGTAASVQGVISMLGAASIGFAIGQMFNGTLIPLASGFALCGLGALGVMVWTESGRLFHSHAPLGREIESTSFF
jgi:DHA1 family bicyclomycin/chloramphenicol resistance-like MFS transporter